MATKKTAFLPTVQDNKKFDIDIFKFYQEHIVQLIDPIRSPINLPAVKHLFTKQSIKDAFEEKPIPGILTPGAEEKESRCHAFYRIIGFPVISKSNDIYNPGHDIIVGDALKQNYDVPERKINKDIKATVANDAIPGFNELSETREGYSTQFLEIFADNEDVDAGALALTNLDSIQILKLFEAPFRKNSQAIEDKFDPKNQSYSLIFLQGSFRQPVNFVDEFGETPDVDNLFKNRYHIIKPFAVDARIDVTTIASQKVAVPFTLDDSYLTTSSSDRSQQSQNKDLKSYVYQTYLETLILKNNTVEDQVKKSGLDSDTIDALKNMEYIKDKQIIQDITTGQVYGITQQQYFLYYFNAIREIISKLVISLEVCNKIKSEYYWLPITGKNGIENSLSIHEPFPVIFNDQELSYLRTKKDEDIVRKLYETKFEFVSSSIEPNVDTSTGISKITLQKYAFLLGKTSSEAMGNVKEDALSKLLKARQKALQVANENLQKIEMICGIFSGFGILDMIIIVAGMCVMPTESLLGFLDADAYERAKKHPKLKGKIPDTNPSNYKKASEELGALVSNWYDIASSFFIQQYVDLLEKDS